MSHCCWKKTTRQQTRAITDDHGLLVDVSSSLGKREPGSAEHGCAPLGLRAEDELHGKRGVFDG